MILAYFVTLKAILIVFYFINSLFKRKNVTQVSIKISKICNFSFSFKPNDKKKVPLKNMVWRGRLEEKFC